MFCYQKNFVNPTLPVDETQFWALVRAKQWNEDIDKFRETGNAQLKRKLPAFIFQATFDETTSKSGKSGAWRKQAATRLTGLVVMDVDHVEAHPLPLPKGGVIATPTPQDYYNVWRETHPELFADLSPLPSGKATGGRAPLGMGDGGRLLLIYITPSGHGLKIVFKARTEWGNLIDNQHAMAKVLGVEVDERCKDASRMSFICKESDILYLDKELFTYENKEFAERYDDAYRAGHSQETRSEGQETPLCLPQGGEKKGRDVKSPNDQTTNLPNDQTTWRGYPIQKIIDARYREKLPCKEDTNRHAESLKLASDLLVMLDGDKALVQQIVEAQPWVQEIIAERNENVAGTVESAAQRMTANEKKYLTQSPSKVMQTAIKEVTGKDYKEAPSNLPLKGEAQENIDRWLWQWGEEIEKLFDKFPLLRDICKGLKRNQYPAALFVGGSLLMTLMTRCSYRFYHRPEKLRRLNCSTLIIGDPASGKSFATRLYEFLAEPMVKADEKGIEAINAYKEQMKTKGANKEKPTKPKVVVRVHPARTSNAQFIQDMVNAVETVDGEEMHLHMLTFDTELDNTMTIQKGGSWIDKQSMELKAFHNEEDGQAYSNLDSVVQNFFVFWNYIYTGTPIALQKKVNTSNFGTGLATRLTCIPLPATNFEMMERETTIDFSSDERLKEWAYKLDRMKGELSLQKIVDGLYDWTARRMMDAKENNSKADEMLLKRCAYHGLNFAAPFIVMRHWGCIHKEGNYYCGSFETDEVDWQLTELLVNIQYACQKHFFGTLAETYFDNQRKEIAANSQRRQKTVEAFCNLPEEFTTEDVMRCFGLSTKGSARSRIVRLQQDHLIEKIGTFLEAGVSKVKYKKTNTIIL